MTSTLNQTQAKVVRDARCLITPERIAQIEAQAQGHLDWTSHISDYLTAPEKQQIRIVWDTLPGSSCWMSAWYCVRNGQDWHGNSVL